MAHFDENSPIIKVCGMRREANIEAVSRCGLSLMGFIFYPPSPRSAIDMPDDTLAKLPSDVTPVAVFVNENEQAILSTCGRYGFKTVQLHGSEPPEMCHKLRHTGLTVLKAVGISTPSDFEGLADYVGAVDLFVFDTKTTSHGGSGRQFDWSILDSYTLEVPYLLSGGISPQDAASVANQWRKHSPQMAGVDLNSRFETEPGIKDAEKLTLFIEQLNHAI